MHKISIIIPIYNVEPFLPKCLESIICQTYQNLEIILVNDGSTDSCPQICEDYAAKDNRIKVIQKDFKTNVQIGSGCNFRISFNTSSQLKNIEAEILEKGGLLWRL